VVGIICPPPPLPGSAILTVKFTTGFRAAGTSEDVRTGSQHMLADTVEPILITRGGGRLCSPHKLVSRNIFKHAQQLFCDSLSKTLWS
jgi:hypothetical protein